MKLIRLVLRLFPLLAIVAAASASADALDDILERKTIRIGVAQFMPWTIKTASGDLIGFEIDLAKKLAADMGVEPEFRLYEWEAIITALEKGEIDVIAGGMSITPKRALRVNFSRPVAESGVGLALNTGLTRDITTLADLNKPKIVIVTVAGTLAHNVSKNLFDKATVKALATAPEAEKEILEARAHGYLAGTSEVMFLHLKNPAKVDVPMSEPVVASTEALAVRKGEQQLLNFLDAWVTAHQADKWLPTTRDYWFATLDWAPDAPALQ